MTFFPRLHLLAVGGWLVGTAEELLLPGESIHLLKRATIFFKPSEFGLDGMYKDRAANWGSKKAARWFHGDKDMSGFSAGKITLTNWRIVFAPVKLQRLHGALSIFLPTITEMDAARKLVLETPSQTYVFGGSRSIKMFAEEIRLRAAAIDGAQLSQLRRLVETHPNCVGLGLEVNPRFLDFVTVAGAVTSGHDLWQAGSSLNVLDLFRKD
jgi:hypothetical protein